MTELERMSDVHIRIYGGITPEMLDHIHRSIDVAYNLDVPIVFDSSQLGALMDVTAYQTIGVVGSAEGESSIEKHFGVLPRGPIQSAEERTN